MQLTVIVPVELKICGPIENHREFWTGASFVSYSTKAFSSFSVLSRYHRLHSWLPLPQIF